MRKNNRKLIYNIFKTGLPIFAELFLVNLFTMMDTAILKWCGTAAIAGVGLTAEPINLLEFSFFALQTAVVTILAGKFAKKKLDEIKKYMVAYMKLCVISVLAISIIVFVFTKPILVVFGGNEETLAIAIPYLKVSLVAFIFRRLYSAITDVLKSIDAPQWSFLLNLISNAINIVLDVCLIYGFGPFPAYGFIGAAIATAIACFIGFILAVFLLIRKFVQLECAIYIADWEVKSYGLIKQILNFSWPLIGEKVMIRLGVFLTIQQVASIGTMEFATYRILISIQNFAYLGFEAIATTALIFLSRSCSTEQDDDAKCILGISIKMGILFAFVCCISFAFGSDLWMKIYSNDIAVITLGKQALLLICIYQPFQAVALILASAFRGYKFIKIPSAITSIGIVFIRPVMAYMLIPSLGVIGAWIAISSDEIFRFIALLFQKKKLPIR